MGVQNVDLQNDANFREPNDLIIGNETRILGKVNIISALYFSAKLSFIKN